MRLRTLLAFLAIGLLLSACSSPAALPEAVSARVAETRAARTATLDAYFSQATTGAYTATPTLTPTLTPSPTQTLTPTPTLPPTPTLTAAPDLRVIIEDPRDFICDRFDFPGSYIPSKPLKNDIIVNKTNSDRGYSFIEDTGRIDGWHVGYYNADGGKNHTPRVFYCYIERFATNEGAHIAITEYFYESQYGNQEVEDLTPAVGDEAYLLTDRERERSGSYRAYYSVRFRFRNMVVEVGAYDWEVWIDLNQLLGVAKMVQARLETGYLGDVVIP